MFTKPCAGSLRTLLGRGCKRRNNNVFTVPSVFFGTVIVVVVTK
jgi:hypothetical protein